MLESRELKRLVRYDRVSGYIMYTRMPESSKSFSKTIWPLKRFHNSGFKISFTSELIMYFVGKTNKNKTIMNSRECHA